MRYYSLLLFSLAVFFLVGCTSSKRRSEQSTLGKLWHNTNAHYNGYFNAEELVEATADQLATQHVDNYNQRLPLFPYVAVENPETAAAELDKAIEKVTVVVSLHPFSNWSDDSYLLAGQAQYLKQDYEAAEKTFRYLVNEYRPKEDRKEISKKARRDAKKGKLSKEEQAAIDKADAEAEAERKDRVRTAEQEKKERARAAKQAAQDRDDYNKQLKKDRKARQKAAKKRQKARKKKRKTPTPRPAAQDSTQVTDPAETTEPEEEEEPETDRPAPDLEPDDEDRPIGMISIFGGKSGDGVGGEQYGEDPDSYFLKHRPVWQEGKLWLARTLIERDNFGAAQQMLDNLRNDRGTFPQVRRELMAVQAYLYIEDGNPGQAIPFLKEAAELTGDRNQRGRFLFVAGQIHQELGERTDAYATFQEVIKARPDYIMEFSARLNMEQNDYLSGQGTAADALAKLDRMAREEKNIPYADRIYYTMARIALQEGDRTAGMEYLEKSLAAGQTGNQRVEAYQMLADINFEQENYLASKLYLDSTLTSMAKNDARYGNTTRLRDNLTGIADNLTMIEEQDSLLRLSEMPEGERLDVARKLIEMKRAANSADRPVSGPTGGGRVPPGGIAGLGTDGRGRPTVPTGGGRANPGGARGTALAGGSDFFAFDDRAVKRGRRNFERTYGDRNLEDNWRRSRRADADLFSDGDDPAVATAQDDRLPSLYTDEELLGELGEFPADDNAREATRMRIQQGLFDLGTLYRDQLNNNRKSIEALEELNSRFERNSFQAESWYYLYLAHREEGNTAESEAYKAKILEKYHDSKFGKILANPNYVNDFLDEEAQRDRAYNEAYQLFDAGRYPEAQRKVESEVSQLFGPHPLKPRYGLLLAMIKGNTESKEAYVNGLKQVISSYNNTPEATRAKEILRLLGEGTGTRMPGVAAPTDNGAFTPAADELHYMIVIFNSPDVDLNAAKVKVSEYNKPVP